MLSKKKQMRLLAVLLVPVVALIVGAAAPQVWADEEPECFFNIELNATDEDVGVQGYFDWDPWKRLTIDDPEENRIARLRARGSLELQGWTEYFYETGEPKLWEDGYTFGEFLARFPESDEDAEEFYLFKATPNDGGARGKCEAEFTHVIPCAPEVDVKVHGSSKVTISWDEVEEVVNTVTSDEVESIVCVDPEVLGLELEIEEYLVIIEGEDEDNDTELQFNVSSDVTEVVIPQSLLGEGKEYKFEILAREESGNQTITEEFFELK
jgi:hypothetical protein